MVLWDPSTTDEHTMIKRVQTAKEVLSFYCFFPIYLLLFSICEVLNLESLAVHILHLHAVVNSH